MISGIYTISSNAIPLTTLDSELGSHRVGVAQVCTFIFLSRQIPRFSNTQVCSIWYTLLYRIQSYIGLHFPLKKYITGMVVMDE